MGGGLPVGELEDKVRGRVVCHDDGGAPMSIRLGGVYPGRNHLLTWTRELGVSM